MNWLFTRAVLALALATPAAAIAQAPAAWHGVYVYEHGAGTGTVVEYRLRLGAEVCEIAAQGFQTDEVVRCRAAARPGNQLDIAFVSYGDGGVTNAFGVQVHRPGERLFTLSNRRGALWTSWGAYSPFEDRRPVARHFRRAR